MAAPFEFSDVQAEHILDMQLARLTRLGRADLEEEMAKLRQTIGELEAILGDRESSERCCQDRAGRDQGRASLRRAWPRSPSTRAKWRPRTSSRTASS